MKSPVRYGAQVLLIAAFYFVAGKLTLTLAIPPGYATAVWPSSGIVLAALLLLGERTWPGVWVGAALVNYTIQYSAPLAAVIATGNTLEAVTVAVLVRRYIGAHGRFEHGEQVVKFVVAAMAGCAVAATVATLALGVGGFMPWSGSSSNWLTWWLGDLAGIIIVAPLLLGWSRPRIFSWSAGRAAECAIFATLLIASTMVVFGDVFGMGAAGSLDFLLLPLIVWAAFRFTQREVATAGAVVCGVAVWHTVGGSGPFATENLNRSLLLLQAFISTVAVTGLALTAVLEERRRVEGQLRLTNEELERFVHVTAHDLQEPLRTVTNFSDLLDRGYRDKLDGEGREYLDFVVNSMARMRRMLSDLLVFSQIDRKAGSTEPVDCEQLLSHVLQNLRVLIEEAGAVVTHDPLPIVNADGTHLELVFQNLIGNAIKFRRFDVSSRVHVSARTGSDDWIFSIQDNGIGINPRHFGLIFEMFERLHGAASYPGNGIGLTICRKIIERHGGRIWLESREAGGSTFYFTIVD